MKGHVRIVTRITKERKFTIQWDTGDTGIESARGKSRAGDMPAKPPCKKHEESPDSDTDDVTS